jgi:hypothetical protein
LIFCFIALLRGSQRRAFKNTANSPVVRKVFTQKKNDKKANANAVFFSQFVGSYFSAFLGKGSSKTPQNKYMKNEKCLTLLLFWPLAHSPCTTGVSDFYLFFGQPLVPRPAVCSLRTAVGSASGSASSACS